MSKFSKALCNNLDVHLRWPSNSRTYLRFGALCKYSRISWSTFSTNSSSSQLSNRSLNKWGWDMMRHDEASKFLIFPWNSSQIALNLYFPQPLAHDSEVYNVFKIILISKSLENLFSEISEFSAMRIAKRTKEICDSRLDVNKQRKLYQGGLFGYSNFAIMSGDWLKSSIAELIKAYKLQENLYNQKHKLYYNKQARNNSLSKILTTVQVCWWRRRVNIST